ncbi:MULTISPECIES: transposase [unclassified Methanosarcina]|uniref:transposase n=1 Tax=unclassified Methanosarcina TaxID=2644672 RepID=UPI0006160437|nr:MULTISPECIES: transposase [unclassified Methanosarcina]AKB18075.1 hypothetical protein MSWHS_1212 [Methanosarcina sp. WWM596]
MKYRRKALTNPLVVDFLKTKIHNISETFDVEVLNIECDKDHFHLLFSAKPSLDIPKYIKSTMMIHTRVEEISLYQLHMKKTSQPSILITICIKQ